MPAHNHSWYFSRACGADICTDCGEHKGLVRCYCGWTSYGGNGYRDLIEMGETIEPDYDYVEIDY